MFNKKADFNSDEFIAICRAHKVKKLYAFGSVISQHFTEDSDIDLIVEIDEYDPLHRGDLLLSIWNEFETYFGRKVDLLTDHSLKNPYLKESVNSTKKLVYSGSKEEIL